MKIRSCVSTISALGCASVSFSQGAASNQHLRFTQEHHWTFSEIGAVGNASHAVPNTGPLPPTHIGAVDYRYRISTTEVTLGQYYEFVLAYAPVAAPNLQSNLGNNIIQYQGTIDGIPRYAPPPAEYLDLPMTQTWRVWARFVNWLHHGGPDLTNPTSAHFEDGAYDTSTFGRVPSGPYGLPYTTDQDSRHPDARFWIPSHDELVKATFYDPNRYGEDQGGYWRYGHGSDDAPIPGDPALGGETNAGHDQQWPAGHTRPQDVGSYPGVVSPWGLLDTTGGAREWTESWSTDDEFLQNQRYVMGASAFFNIAFGDIDVLFPSSPTLMYGLRLATVIPAPGVPALIGVAACFAARRKRSV